MLVTAHPTQICQYPNRSSSRSPSHQQGLTQQEPQDPWSLICAMVGQLDHCSCASKDSGRFMSSLNPTLCKRRTVAGYHSLPPPKDSARRVPWAVSPRSGETQAGGTLYGFPLFSVTQHCVRSLCAHLVGVFQPPGPWSTCMGFVFLPPSQISVLVLQGLLLLLTPSFLPFKIGSGYVAQASLEFFILP